MSDRSAIEWMDATWNRMRGCMKVSPGCKFFSIVTLAGTPRCWLRFTVGPAWTVNTEPFGHRAAVLDEQHGDDRLMVDCVAQDERQLARARRQPMIPSPDVEITDATRIGSSSGLDAHDRSAPFNSRI